MCTHLIRISVPGWGPLGDWLQSKLISVILVVFQALCWLLCFYFVALWLLFLSPPLLVSLLLSLSISDLLLYRMEIPFFSWRNSGYCQKARSGEQSEEGLGCSLYIPGMPAGPWNVVEPRWERGSKAPSSLSQLAAPIFVPLIPARISFISCKSVTLSKIWHRPLICFSTSYLEDNLGCLWSLFGAISKISILSPSHFTLPLWFLYFDQRGLFFLIGSRVWAFMPQEFWIC